MACAHYAAALGRGRAYAITTSTAARMTQNQDDCPQLVMLLLIRPELLPLCWPLTICLQGWLQNLSM